MQIAKKYFTESLIQLTIFLSLIGVRVDIDGYLNGVYPPVLDIDAGPSSAYIQTSFHSLRDTLDGYSVHPKCPELDYFFASRRLLEEVRALGSPRFPTRLSAWLVHQVSAADDTESRQPSAGSSTESSPEAGRSTPADPRQLPESGPEKCQPAPQSGQGPCDCGACIFLKKEEEDVPEKEPASPNQLAHSSTLEQEVVVAGPTAGTDPALARPLNTDLYQHWSHLLSLSVSDLENLDSLVTDMDATGAISHDVSLRDAMVTRDRVLTSERPDGLQQADDSRREPCDSAPSDPGVALGPAALGGCLDEAVFDQINQLSLDTMDVQLLDCLGNTNPQALADVESDSGLSLESSSGGPASPDTSEISFSSSSCEDECGATGYSSEGDSLSSKVSWWTPTGPSHSVWHDHSYPSSSAFLNRPPVTFPHKRIKDEPLSDDEGPKLEEGDLSRDEMLARAMCIPFSALQIVNMPVEEFLEVLEGHAFSSEQVTLLRDIRRRGKNKLAAQNCRKRKLDAIIGLQEEVARLQAQRNEMVKEKHLTVKTVGAVGQQIRRLTRDILARMRDGSGQPLDPERFTLQCRANGRVVVQPLRRPAVSTSRGNKTEETKKDKKP